MPLIDITNPAVINFLNENYAKENLVRVNWLFKHRDLVDQAATLTRDPMHYFEQDVIAHSMYQGLATITRDHVVAGSNRRKKPIRDAPFIPGIKNLHHGHSIIHVGLGNSEEDPRLDKPVDSIVKDPVMRPVDSNLTKIIYKSKPEYGREQYITKRSKIPPENRYYFNECSNWDYGWGFSDSERPPKTKFGKYGYLTRNLFTRVGPQPDPVHYKPPEIPGPSKCTV